MESVEKSHFTVFVEGNVGSGKTRFLNYFKKFDEFLILEEPIDKWTNLNGFNLLDLKFNDPEKFLFTFQNYATLTRLRQHMQTTDKPIKMMERSLLTARNCFIENFHKNHNLHDGMYHVLNEWFEFVNEFHPVQCNAIIYLKTSPEVAFNRVVERGREEEASITLAYLKQLHDFHENYLFHNENLANTQVITVDADVPKEVMDLEFMRCYHEIKKLCDENEKNRCSSAIVTI